MASFFSRGGLAARESVPAGARERLGLAFRIVAAIKLDGEPAARLELRLVRHLLGRDEVTPAHFGTIELQLMRHAIE